MTDFLHGVQVVNIDTGARSIAVASTSVIGIVGTAPLADADAFPINTPVLVTSLSQAAKLSAKPGTEAGTLPGALDAIFDQSSAVVVVIRVESGASDSATLANVLGGVNAQTGAYSGVHALLAAKSIVGVKPRILLAPGFTHVHPADPASPDTVLANPVVAELLGIADKLRAIIIKDGPNSNDDAAKTSTALTGSKRVYVVDPAVLVQQGEAIISRYASGAVAGAIARSDNERGWWASPSNQELYGIVGTARAIDFGLSDATSRANLLNQANVATIIREGGFRLWGNRTASIDPKWQFLCVVRTADIIADSLEAAHLWAVDRGISKTYVDDVREGVNAFLRDLKTQGAILGGNCWIDPELNAADSVAQGRFYWDFDFTPTYPGEQLTFRMHMNNNYVSEIF
ncbi:phage tail sheath C-terminal domain-containing protein [Stenotrophomonas sp. NA06056]|uniref:phage tail sheath C-terminal domain-containing protein n=1 Tax=Stenotrophomonas sp. NA06056 TaxID=2742129 RepID=UPI00158A1D9C|nr:phage tail sheath C-terminal domain-containing protein [Stenotrophomonas sp. NA06056]QKW57821.1 phage tail sheath subtilisin-like domain-containing protein [Stenotrophomonas sp. NA06056]